MIKIILGQNYSLNNSSQRDSIFSQCKALGPLKFVSCFVNLFSANAVTEYEGWRMTAPAEGLQS